MKVCTKCKIEKELTEFNKCKTNKDGLQFRCKSCRRTYYEANRDKKKAYGDAYREANRDKINAKKKVYREANRDKVSASKKAWYENNKDRVKAQREDYKDKRNARRRERKKTDPLFKMKCNLRNRTYQAFRDKGYSKTSKTQEVLGVDWKIVKTHIEKQFTEGMSWDNYGFWHIDHMIPLASANTIEETIILCHYTNLQPLWALDNIKKGARII